MSADNGIYIAKFPDGFRVAHALAIENTTYYPEGSKERQEILAEIFSHSKVFDTKDKAIIEAHHLEDEILNDDFCNILEYGVRYIGEFEDFSPALKKFTSSQV